MKTFADLWNGPFGHLLLKRRGNLRLSLGKALVAKYNRLSNQIIAGLWEPPAPATGYAVSMTSWSRRADSLLYALLSLLSQKQHRPKLIVVWLAQEDISVFQSDVYSALTKFGVMYKSCDDLKVHNKWLHMIESGYSDPYVICDDDIFYPSQWLISLMHEARNDAFTGTRCHQISYKDGSISPYTNWKKEVAWSGSPSASQFVTGVGGAIIVPSRIGGSFRDRSRIVELCPKADDIWLNAAHAAAGIPRYKTLFTFPCLEVPTSLDSGLQRENVDGGGNDTQMPVLDVAIREGASELVARSIPTASDIPAAESLR